VRASITHTSPCVFLWNVAKTPDIPGLIKRPYRCQNQNEIQRLHDINPRCFSAPPCQHLGKSVYNITARDFANSSCACDTRDPIQLSPAVQRAVRGLTALTQQVDVTEIGLCSLRSDITTHYNVHTCTRTYTHTIEIPAQITDMTVTDTDIVKDKLTNLHSTCFLPIRGGMEKGLRPLPLVKPSSGATGLI